jgi:hypothetical protein
LEAQRAGLGGLVVREVVRAHPDALAQHHQSARSEASSQVGAGRRIAPTRRHHHGLPGSVPRQSDGIELELLQPVAFEMARAQRVHGLVDDEVARTDQTRERHAHGRRGDAEPLAGADDVAHRELRGMRAEQQAQHHRPRGQRLRHRGRQRHVTPWALQNTNICDVSVMPVTSAVYDTTSAATATSRYASASVAIVA